MVAVANGAASRQSRAEGEFQAWAGGTPPSFTLPTLDGPRLDLAALRGRIVLAHFFASWCEPCRNELPALRGLVTRTPSDALGVISLAIADNEMRLRRLLDVIPVNFPVLLDADRAVAQAWGVSALPTTIVLDGNLTPRLIVEAPYAWDGLALTQLQHRLSLT